MPLNLKRIFTATILLLIFTAAASAAEGDVELAVLYNDGTAVTQVGTGLQRGEDLWITEDAARAAGIPVSLSSNGKSFELNVDNPAEVFGDNDLKILAGKSLPLSFYAMEDGDAKYFNVLGMERVTRVTPQVDGDVLTLYAMADGEPLPIKEPAPTPIPGRKLRAAWDHVRKDTPDLRNEPVIAPLDVIMPTWFNLTDGHGGMANRASAAYVEEAHRRGMQVWGLVSNGFSKQLSSALFKNNRAINLFVARIIAYAKLYNLDGINIDFEGLDANDRDGFVKFVAHLAQYMRARGLTYSVDVFIPANSNSSRSHDRKSLSKHADYIMLMAYDQHWRTCSVAGSVAALNWVEAAVKNTLAEGVPHEKLVLGVPFYMRRWEETPLKNGKVKVKSLTYTMADADTAVVKYGAKVKWLEKEGQHYFQFKKGGKTYKVWVEDAESLKRKVSLVNKYGLAGFSGWRRGHENIEVWGPIDEVLD